MTALDNAREALLSTPQMSGFTNKVVYRPRRFVSSQQQDITLYYGPVVRYIELTWVDTRSEHPRVEARYWEKANSERVAVYTAEGWTFR